MAATATSERIGTATVTSFHSVPTTTIPTDQLAKILRAAEKSEQVNEQLFRTVQALHTHIDGLERRVIDLTNQVGALTKEKDDAIENLKKAQEDAIKILKEDHEAAIEQLQKKHAEAIQNLEAAHHNKMLPQATTSSSASAASSPATSSSPKPTSSPSDEPSSATGWTLGRKIITNAVGVVAICAIGGAIVYKYVKK